MKKNQNILNYIDTYKKNHHIVHLDEKGKFYKGMGICFKISWVYSVAMLALSLLSTTINYINIKNGFYMPKYVIIPTIVAFVIMISVPVLFKFKLKEIACGLVILSQPVVYFAYHKFWRYGLGYRMKFYWSILVPVILVLIFTVILLAVLLYSRYRKNRLYNEIIENLYRKYGKKDGKKLSNSEWNEFLDNYKAGSKEEIM